ncbi:MAG: hypothetical protein WKG07_06570 [Hymenobacter sp.]
MHGKGMQVYEDMVMNHLTFRPTRRSNSTSAAPPTTCGPASLIRGATTRTVIFSGITTTSTPRSRPPNNGWYQWHAYDFQPYSNGDAYDNLLGLRNSLFRRESGHRNHQVGHLDNH